MPFKYETSSDIVTNKWIDETKKGKGAKSYYILHSGTLRPKKSREREREKERVRERERESTFIKREWLPNRWKKF